VQEGITHWIMWANKPQPHSRIEEEAKTKFGPSTPTTYWVNPVELQSVLGVRGKRISCLFWVLSGLYPATRVSSFLDQGWFHGNAT